MQCYQLFILQPDNRVYRAIIKLKEAGKFLEKVGEDIEKALKEIATEFKDIGLDVETITVDKPDTNGCTDKLNFDAKIKISDTDDNSLKANLKKILKKVKPKEEKEPQQNNVTLDCAKEYSECLKTLLESVKIKAKSELLQKIHEIEAQANKLVLGDYAEFREIICSTILLKANDFKSACEKIQEMTEKFSKTCTCKSNTPGQDSKCQCNGNCGDKCKCNGGTAANFKDAAISIRDATDIFAEIGDGLIAAFEKACQCRLTDKANEPPSPKSNKTLNHEVGEFDKQVTELCKKVTALSSYDATRPLRAKLESATIRLMAISELLQRINEYGFADTLRICSPELQILAEQLKKEAKAFKEQTETEKFKSDPNIDKIKGAGEEFEKAAQQLETTIKALTQDNIKCNIESFKNAIYAFYTESKSVTDKELNGYSKRTCTTEQGKDELEVLKEKLGEVGSKFQAFGTTFQESINKLVGKSKEEPKQPKQETTDKQTENTLSKLFKATDVAARDCEAALRVLDTAYLKAANAADEINKTIKLKASTDKLVEKVWEKIDNVQNAICTKIQGVSDCTKARINKVCEHLCSKIGTNQDTVENCIKTTCTNICSKIKALHTCFQGCIRAACTQACTKINDACTAICEAIKKICDCAKTSATQICTAVKTCINLVCVTNCQCQCCKTPPTDCCNDKKECTNADCVCIKCTVITSANKICVGIDGFTNGLKSAVEAACKCFCGCCDNIYKALDEVSNRADEVEIKFDCNGQNNSLIKVIERKYDDRQVKNSIINTSANGGANSAFYESVIKITVLKISTDLKNVFRCNRIKCYCTICKPKDNNESVDCCLPNDTDKCFCRCYIWKCKCIKCTLILAHKIIRMDINRAGGRLKISTQTACKAICTRIDTIHAACQAACKKAQSGIESACKDKGKDICQACTAPAACNVTCQEGCKLKDTTGSGSQCDPCDKNKDIAQPPPTATESHSRKKRHAPDNPSIGNVSAEDARALLQQPGSYTNLSRTRRSAGPQAPATGTTCDDTTSNHSNCNFECTTQTPNTTQDTTQTALKAEINEHANAHAKSILYSATEYAIHTHRYIHTLV